MRECKGMWVAIDGVDAVGKSTQVKNVVERLRDAGINPVVGIPEFSSSPVGLVIMKILERQRFYALHPDLRTPLADTLTLLSDSVYHYETKIAPTIVNGGIAVSDRGVVSFIGYQAIRIAERSNLLNKRDVFRWINTLAQHCFIIPSLTVLLVVSEEEMIRRMIERGESVPDEQELAFLRNVNSILRRVAGIISGEVMIVDGSGSIENVTTAIVDLILRKREDCNLK